MNKKVAEFKEKLIELIALGKEAENSILHEVGTECLDAELMDEVTKKLESLKENYFSDVFRNDTADS